MNKTNQLWKFSWNPSGYFIEKIKIDLSKKYVNNEFYLTHTYFNTNKFLAYSYLADNKKKFYNVHTSLQDNTDFLFTGLDEELSKLAGTNVYSRLKLISSRVQELNEINIDCTFLADVIEASSIGQDVNKTSDVEHKSLTLKETIVAPEGIFNSIKSNFIDGDFGVLSKDKMELNSSSLNLNNELLISKSGLIINKDQNIKLGSENYNVSFNTSTKSATLNVGEKREGILFRGPKFDNIPVYGIPVILSDDKTRLGFVPWLSIEPEQKRIKVGNININDSTLFQDNNFDFAKNYKKATMTICDTPFITIDRESNMVNLFNGIIKINLSTRDVIMNGFTFNPSFFNSILQMQRDINFLKSKIN